ncbi:MAG: hypothetical protein M1544_00145 [Candidatus Marsarchaeota archaeon]|nr:hypothetical protein [Candidatus Marsarchaeota archaeon]
MTNEAQKDGKYSSVKSQYIRDKIKESSWSRDRKYVDDLILLERYIAEGPKGFADALHYSSIKQTYRKEYAELMKEFKPEEFERQLAKEKKSIEESERQSALLRKEIEERERQLHNEWLEMGGRE